MRYVGIADLKARLSHHLKSVRRGETLTVRDRDTAVARIVPIDTTASGLVVHPRKDPRGRLCDVPLPPPSGMKADIVGLLLEERGDR
jgi:antitoxin (DNA-binding transcriptional repressor) of toxin-antitoxin stability system